MPCRRLLLIGLMLFQSFCATAQNNTAGLDSADAADLAAFLDKFAELPRPAAITKPYHLTKVKAVGYLNWTRRIGLDKYPNLAAVGVIKKCGNTKTLLLVQMPGNSKVYIFHIITLRNGELIKHETPKDGIFRYHDESAFWNLCTVKIDYRGGTTITTAVGNGTVKTVFEPCE